MNRHLRLISATCAMVGLLAMSNASHGAPVTRYTSVSGVWIDADRAAQGLMIEQLDSPYGSAEHGGNPRVGVTWFTWAPAGDANPGPRWMFGVGRRLGADVVVDSMQIALGGSFPASSAHPPAAFAAWGRLHIQFLDRAEGGPNLARLWYEGPSDWGSGFREIKQMTVANTGWEYDFVLDPPMPIEYFHSGGTYSDPTSPGQGWVLNHYWRDVPSASGGLGNRVETALLWFSYDEQQRPTWSFGFDTDLAAGLPEFPMLRAVSGGTFEGGAPVLQPWGIVRMRGSGGPPSGFNCSEPRFIGFSDDVIGTPPPIIDRPIFRITITFDPHVPAPRLCFS